MPPFSLRRAALASSLLAATLVVAPAAAPVEAAGLAISKSSSDDVVEAGQTFDYSILVSCSTTTGDCVNAVVTDVLPPELSGAAADVFLPPLIGATASYDEGSRTVTWEFTNDLGAGDFGMATGSSVELIVAVKFPAGSTPDGTVATNTATFTADTDIVGDVATSNPHPVTATSSFAFDLVKSVGVPNIGLPVTYDIELCSDPTGGIDMQAGATLRDTLPAGAVFLSATSGGVEVSPGVIEWTLPAVAADGECQRVGSVTVEFPSGVFVESQPVTNTASVLDPIPVGSINPEPPIDTSITVPLVLPTGEGGARKTGAEWITPGQPFDYSLDIQSVGFLPITDAVLSDVIPPQIDVTSITVPAGVDRVFYTSDLNATPLPLTFTPGVPIPKSALVGPTDFIASLQVEADTVGAFETFSVIVGALVIDGGSDRSSDPIDEGVGQPDGTNVQNCASLTYIDHESNAQAPAAACSNTLVKQEFAVPRLLKTGDAGPFIPGTTVSWDITLTNATAASTDLDEFIVRDLLPDQYDDGTPIALSYVPGSAALVSKPAAAPDPVIDDTGTFAGRTQLDFRWTTADGNPYLLQPEEAITITYQATIPPMSPPGTITNHASLSNWLNQPANPDPDKQVIWECDPPAVADPDLVALNAADAASGNPCYASSPVGVQAITGLGSIKWVRGEADLDVVIAAAGDPNDPDPEAAGFSRFPESGFTYPGGYVDYRVILNNPGNVATDDLVILDIFPFVGDSGVLTGARGSEWRPILVEPIVLPPVLAGQAVVYYSIEEDPCRDARLKIPAGCTDWSLTPPDPMSDTQAVMIDIDDDFAIPAGGELQVDLRLTAPAGAQIDGTIAWNSFGFSSARADTGSELLAAEPRKVGVEVRVPATALYGDYVWFDFDHDGLQDPEESGPELIDQPARLTGINGVRAQFYEDLTGNGPTEDDRFVRSTITQDDFDGNPGFYSFPEVDAGVYYAVFDVPTGLELTLADQGGDDTVDSDAYFDSLTFEGSTIVNTFAAVFTQVVVPTTALGPDETDLTWDVGFWDPTNIRSSLGDFVWYDNNTTGVQDAAPDGVAGVTVNLWWVGEDGAKNDGGGDDVELDSTTTDATGNYRFDWLVPGPNYYVEFDEPAGHMFTTLDTGGDEAIDSDVDPATGFTSLVDLDNGPDPAAVAWDPDTQTVEPQWDAGLYFPNTIGNYVWEDLDRDGVQEAGEGLDSVPVTLYAPGLDGVIGGGDDIQIATTMTAGSGFYSFSGLPNGDYFVVVTPPVTYLTTLDDVGGDDGVDSDGIAGSAEYAGRTVMSSITTLQVEPGADLSLNTADDVAENDPTWDFGFYRLASLGDYVWEDLNRNGIQNAGEPGINGVTATLLDEFGIPVPGATTVTANNPVGGAPGFYEFTGLVPGTYSVRFDTSATPTTVDRPWFYSPQDQGGNDAVDSDVDPNPVSPTFAQTASTTLESNQNDPTLDAGIWRWASLGDYVWHDLDGDGAQTASEPGINGVTVTLLDITGTPVPGAVTVTANNPVGGAPGWYEFDDLDPDFYSVEFDLTSPVLIAGGFVATGQNEGGDDAVDSDANRTTGVTAVTQLTSNEHDPTWDAGFYIPVNLGDFVWYDSNIDGLLDAGDADPATPGIAGINGVTVVLLDETGTPVPGATTVTANDPVGGAPGWYEFADLRPDTYEVEFVLPAGFAFSPPNVGGDDTIDSDAVVVTPTTARTGPIVLTSGVDDFTWDAGLYQFAGLGDFVWNDLDANGAQDAGEPGINGVTVQLLDAAGDPIAGVTTVTANNPVGGAPGWYEFTQLVPGTYGVQFDLASPALAGFVVSPRDATSDALDSDASTVDGSTVPTVLDLNEFDPTIDGGFYLPASLGDFVWDDLDGDGAQDAGEPGINGVAVQLLDASLAPIPGATTVTANNPVGGAPGFYEFTDLVPGTYAVQFGLASVALTTAGYVQSPVDATDDASDSDADASGITPTTTLISGQNDPTLDAGFYIPVAVGDYVWEDLNGDGFQNVGEPGVNGVDVILLDAAGDPVPGASTTTANNPVGGAAGFYEFIDLDPGIYSVQFVLSTVPAGFVPTIRDVDLNVSDGIDSDADTASLGVTSATAFLDSGDTDYTLDMGLVLPVVVGDFVWHDLNGNGIFDVGEPPIADVDVDLYLVDPLGGPDTLIDSTSTALSGLYQFADLTPGDYYVEFDLTTLPTGMVATLQDQGGDDALDSDADPTTGQTPATGFLSSQESDLTLDLGAYFPVTVGDFVWDDLDGDGIQDAGEPGINGVTVQLLDAAGDPIVGVTTVTANNPVGGAPGFYEFSGLPPAAYGVDFDLSTLPAGYVVSPRDQGGDDTLDSDGDLITGVTAVGSAIPSGGSDPTHDLGVYLPVSVGDFVFEDLDGDGVQDAGEPGVEGVDVTLFLVDPLGGAPIEVGTDTTDVDGLYRFDDLPPGAYFVTFDLATVPADFVVTFPDLGGDDTVDSDANRLTGVTAPTPFLTSGSAADLSLDMGVFRPVAVGDFVFEDIDGDGVQDAGELGVEDVGVTLFLVDPLGGAPIEVGTDTTDVDGLYRFDDLPPGAYFVTFDLATVPADFVVTFPDVGGDDTVDSDANRLTGVTAPTPFLTSGSAADLSLDMGIFLPLSVGDFAWNDLNGNGVQDAGEPGVEGVAVTLFSVGPDGDAGTADDIDLGTTATDVDGAYVFIGLDPDEYFVVFDVATLPGGFVPTFANVGDEALDSDADPATGATRTTGFLDSQSTDRGLDIGLYIPVSVGDFVWFDLSGDGVQDAGEPGVEAIGVTLFSVGPDGVANTADDVDLGDTATDVDGAYEFVDLPPDSYYVVFDLATIPAGQLATATDRGDDATDSDADRTTGATPATGLIPSGSEDRTLDMGLVVPVAIGDYVWEDTNADGVQDGDESGIAGVTVNLLLVGSDGVAGSADDVFVASMTTGADGDYLFTNQLPGNYFVEFDLTTLPDGYVVTLTDVGTDDTVDSDADPSSGITRPTGDLDGAGVDTNDIDLDLGAYVPAVIGDFVWEDRNGDGVQQAGEPGVAGVRVILIDPGPDGVAGTADDIEVDSLTTDADGAYLFTGVPPGDYVIEIDINTLPGGAIFSPTSAGGPGTDSDVDPATGRTGTILVPFGGDDRTWDAGFFVPFDLRLTKAAEGDFRVGETGTFVLTITNAGPGVAFGPLELVDELPAGLTFNGAVGAPWSCTAVGQRVTCLHDADLAANISSVLRLVVNVTPGAVSGIVNTASVRSLGGNALDSNGPNDTASSPPIIVQQPVTDLPRTGQSPLRPIWAALMLLGLGIALTSFASRRRRGHSI